MLIKRSPDAYEKLSLLGSMAGDDVLSNPLDARPSTRMPYSSAKKNPIPGVYRAAMPNGKFINLMRVMFTDFCMMDCHYCPNSHWVPRKRFAFKTEELVSVFANLHQRHTVDGLFLSSGIAGGGSKTTERLIKVVDAIRNNYGFKGYIQMKVMPGTDYHLVEAAHRLGTRLSINLETPTVEMMKRLSKMKDLQRDILTPMSWVHKLTQQKYGATVGQATQLVVGAADESDRDIFQRIDQLYGEWNLKRVYYSAFRPVKYTPLEEHPATPMIREHRLYQTDWLKRVYKFSNQEIGYAFDRKGFLPLDQDPKTAIALENVDAFPLDINTATHDQLLRVPGIGPVSAQRIDQNRRRHSIDNWRDLEAMRVVRKRAWPFITFSGHRPLKAKQLKMAMVREESTAYYPSPETSGRSDGLAPCGQPRSCLGCPMFGAPGHPGHPTYDTPSLSGVTI